MNGWQPILDEASRQRGIAKQQALQHGQPTIGGYIYKCERCGAVSIGAEPPPRERYFCWYHRLKRNSKSEIE